MNVIFFHMNFLSQVPFRSVQLVAAHTHIHINGASSSFSLFQRRRSYTPGMPEGLSDALIAAMTEERLGSNLSAFNFWAAIGFIWCSCFFALDFNSFNNKLHLCRLLLLSFFIILVNFLCYRIF